MGKTNHSAAHVLVVDDDNKFLTFTSESLALEGFLVSTAHNGKEALRECARQLYDLIVLDLKLPDMNGKDVFKFVRERSPSSDVMIVTGYQDTPLAVDLLKLGAKEYITKPIDPAELIQRVKSAIRAHVAEQRLKQLQFEFSSRLLYDLRSPLHTIISTIEYLGKDTAGKLTERQQLLLENVKTNASQMNSLLNDMIDLTLFESGNLEIEKLPTNLDELVPTVCQRFLPQASSKNISIHTKLVGNIPTLEVDPGKIEQVLMNLLDNGIKYTNSGGSITVTLSAVKYPRNCRDQECIQIAVKDTGVGIPKDELPLAFDKYKDLLIGKSSHKRTTGIGLAICRNIIEAHSGCITVESEPGRGSNFRILLPVETQ